MPGLPRTRRVRGLVGLAASAIVVSACGGIERSTTPSGAPGPTLPSVGLTPNGLTPGPATSPAGVLRPMTDTQVLPTSTAPVPTPPTTVTTVTTVTTAMTTTAPTTSAPVSTVAAAPSAPPTPVPTLTLGTRADDDPVTACWAVTHIGDSTSVGMTSTGLLPDPGLRLEAQYARVGVSDIRIDAVSARAIKEARTDVANAQTVAFASREAGFRGCWVFAVGTNDAANVAIGSDTGFDERIARMMAVAGDEPVLWVTAATLKDDGPWADVNMQRWNTALTQAAARFPSMRIFDWGAVAEESWFLSDGIHYNAVGYAARARLIADALARAFPG